MRPILQLPDGLPDLNDIYSLDQDELREWVDVRLQGLDPYLPIDSRLEIDLRGVFVWAWGEADPKSPFRERLEHAFRRLATPVLKHERQVSANWLFELLLLGIETEQQLDSSLLLEAFRSRWSTLDDFARLGVDSLILDYLSRQPQIIEKDFWAALIGVPRYTLVSFLALRRTYGLRTASGFLRTVLHLHVMHPSEVRLDTLALVLASEYEPDRLCQILEQSLGQGELEPLYSCLRAAGIEIPTAEESPHHTPSELAWEWELRRLLHAPPEKVENVPQFVTELLRESQDIGRAEFQFHEAVERLVREWIPANPGAPAFVQRLLDLLFLFRTPAAEIRLIDYVTRDTSPFELRIRALEVLASYFPQPEPSQIGYKRYTVTLESLLALPRFVPFVATRLVELGLLSPADEQMRDAIERNHDTIQHVVRALLRTDILRSHAGASLANIRQHCLVLGDIFLKLFENMLPAELPQDVFLEYEEQKWELSEQGRAIYQSMTAD
jgi:hypothetical protein